MSQTIVFEKMHGIGNDFVLIDNRQQKLNMTTETIVSLANRYTGIGFDQLILLDESNNSQCDVAYRFFNPDGSEAEQCGNGQRCISLYLHIETPQQTKFCVSGLAGMIHSTINNSNNVQVDMGSISSIHELTVIGQSYYHVDFGNPHLITIVNNASDCDLNEMNDRFTQKYPDGINFEIVEIVSEDEIILRVHERGTGETLACGSGACATVAALQHGNKLNQKVKVLLPGGTLVVESNQENILLTGPAAHVFTGEILI